MPGAGGHAEVVRGVPEANAQVPPLHHEEGQEDQGQGGQDHGAEGQGRDLRGRPQPEDGLQGVRGMGLVPGGAAQGLFRGCHGIL